MVFNPRCEVWQYFDNLIEEGVAVCKLCKQRLKNDRSYSLRKHMRKLHNSESVIWKYFDNITGQSVAQCKICGKHIRNNRSFNLSHHLKKLHNIVVVGNNELENQNASTSAPKRTSLLENPPKSKHSSKYLCIEMDENILMRCVMGLMLDEGMVPQMFGSQNMQAILRPICEALCGKESQALKIDEVETERVLCSLATHIRKNFSNELHWRLLSLKIDTDLNAPESTFCVSALFVKNGELQTQVLGIIDLKGQSCLTEENIKEILHKFNIDSNQIISAYWDDTKTHYNKQVNNCEYLNEIETFELVNEVSLGGIKVERYIGVIAQLCILDILKHTDIFLPFLECRNLVNYINNKSNGYHGLFKDSNLIIPQLDSPWKWGSTYIMMNDLKESRSILKNIKYECRNCPADDFNLNDNLWTFIEAFCKAVNFIQRTLIRYYSEELHFGDFYAQWLKCKLLTAKFLNNNNGQNDYLRIIASELLKCIEKRTNDFLSQERYDACLYLDPRFQHTLSTQQNYKAQRYLKMLWNRFKIYNTKVMDNTVNLESSAGLSLTQRKLEDEDDDNTFLNKFLCESLQAHDSRISDIYSKFETLKLTFQPVDTNILTYWKDQAAVKPEVYALSEICFAIPATQVYYKICYSHIYERGDYSQLSAFTKENLIHIRLNANFVDNAIKHLELFKERDKKSYDEGSIDV